MILEPAKEIVVIMVLVRMVLVCVICNGEVLVVKFLFAKMNVVFKENAQRKVVSAIKDTEEMIVVSDLWYMVRSNLQIE